MLPPRKPWQITRRRHPLRFCRIHQDSADASEPAKNIPGEQVILTPGLIDSIFIFFKRYLFQKMNRLEKYNIVRPMFTHVGPKSSESF